MAKHLIIMIFGMIGYIPLMNAQEQTAADSIINKEKFDAIVRVVLKKEQNFRAKPVLVNVINTCSIPPLSCLGEETVGSVSLVEVMEGQYIGDSIYVVGTCKETAYEIEQEYKLKSYYRTSVSMELCNKEIYTTDWNFKMDEHKYFIIFGPLTKK